MIARADFDDPALAAFLAAHHADMAPTAPPESQHALGLDELRAPHVRLWTLHDDGVLVGTVALAGLEDGHEELKSMRTAPHARGRGVARRLLAVALEDAGPVGSAGSRSRPAPRSSSRRPTRSTPHTDSCRARRSATTPRIRTASS
ncbi:hypothetical protein TPB0596_13670 [Tsukamurella pulmonis]|uniref:GNAT family N-acetyltransferase n=1 Tax=Tsukamurella pulmonis TaxID=47312 RepID=UPI001EDCDA26|nr:GNAT family N-acetyltransferase [Tsukamurella pulmonis]BDD81604.1 hypothetical protein TPB0596_13670 [Tsukamurella pulmonis]